MDIKLYQLIKPKNQVNKTAELSDELVKTGTLKDGTSVIDPVILVKGSNELFANYNYIHIPAFNRYYFINEIKSVRKDLTELSLHVDVLNSWKDDFLKNIGVVASATNIYNLYYNDANIPKDSRPIVTRHVLNSPFGAKTSIVLVGLNRSAGTISAPQDPPPAEQTPTQE